MKNQHALKPTVSDYVIRVLNKIARKNPFTIVYLVGNIDDPDFQKKIRLLIIGWWGRPSGGCECSLPQALPTPESAATLFRAALVAENNRIDERALRPARSHVRTPGLPLLGLRCGSCRVVTPTEVHSTHLRTRRGRGVRGRHGGSDLLYLYGRRG